MFLIQKRERKSEVAIISKQAHDKETSQRHLQIHLNEMIQCIQSINQSIYGLKIKAGFKKKLSFFPNLHNMLIFSLFPIKYKFLF